MGDDVVDSLLYSMGGLANVSRQATMSANTLVSPGLNDHISRLRPVTSQDEHLPVFAVVICVSFSSICLLLFAE